MDVFLQALDIPLQWQKGNVFSDVTRQTSYAAAIETAYHEGMIEGTSADQGSSLPQFLPDSSINRAEMAKLLITIQEKIKKLNASSSAR